MKGIDRTDMNMVCCVLSDLVWKAKKNDRGLV